MYHYNHNLVFLPWECQKWEFRVLVQALQTWCLEVTRTEASVHKTRCLPTEFVTQFSEHFSPVFVPYTKGKCVLILGWNHVDIQVGNSSEKTSTIGLPDQSYAFARTVWCFYQELRRSWQEQVQFKYSHVFTYRWTTYLHNSVTRPAVNESFSTIPSWNFYMCVCLQPQIEQHVCLSELPQNH